MLTIKTFLAPSAVHGIGLFAAEPIAVGEVVWKFNKLVDRVYSEKTFLKICLNSPDDGLAHLLNASYLRGGKFYYLTDNARFINHSEDFSNIVFEDDLTEVALREITTGEELLENYLLSYDRTDYFFRETFDPDPLHYVQTICNKELGYAYRADLP